MARKANPDEINFTKKRNKQSKNIEDLRDKPVGPKRVLKPTKAKKRSEAEAKLTRNALESTTTTNKINIKDIPSDASTLLRNRYMNYIREGKFGDKLGVKLKNKGLDSKPTKFKRTQPMSKKD